MVLADRDVAHEKSIMLVREAQRSAPRRILLLTTAFPPSSVVGALRWEKFARYLDEAGIALDVIANVPDEAEALDRSRLESLPSTTRVWGAPARPSMLLRVLSRLHALRARLRPEYTSLADAPTSTSAASAPAGPTVVRTAEFGRWPRSSADWQRAYRGRLAREQELSWTHSAREIALRLVREQSYVAIVSSGPPNLAHAAASDVAAIARRPFIMDMRDPWGTAVSVPIENASAIEWRFARRTEANCVHQAYGILVNTPLARDLMRARYPKHADRCHVVMNGTDDDAPFGAPSRTRFVIMFAGSIYIDRDPRLVFRAAAALIAKCRLSPEQFGFEFIGSVEGFGDKSTMQIAREEGVEAFVTLQPFIPRRELLERLRSASVLLSLPQDVETSIPAKIFEYMMYPSWLLILAPGNSATGRLLVETNADVIDPTDVAAMTSAMQRRYAEHEAGIVPTPIGAEGRFSRAAQARVVTTLLNQIANSSEGVR